jgi:hypothetical protein
MVGKLVTRGSARDRHGRGIRRPLWSPKFQPGVVRQSAFEAAVNDATGYLRDYYPDDFAELRTVITDWPPMKYDGMAHYSLHKPTKTIYIYRIPLQHLGRRKDPIDEMMRIERIVIEAAALLIDRDVRDFLGED